MKPNMPTCNSLPECDVSDNSHCVSQEFNILWNVWKQWTVHHLKGQSTFPWTNVAHTSSTVSHSCV